LILFLFAEKRFPAVVSCLAAYICSQTFIDSILSPALSLVKLANALPGGKPALQANLFGLCLSVIINTRINCIDGVSARVGKVILIHLLTAMYLYFELKYFM
jgi:hypothetical protein